jgi:GxxExxY protein
MDGVADGLLYAQETFRIRGAVFEVYRAMGPGFLEAVYHECLEIEFSQRGVAFESRKPLVVRYRGECLRQSYIADFLCFGRIILELKVVRALAPEHRAQTINYLRATGLRLGLLVNFGAASKAEIERFAL